MPLIVKPRETSTSFTTGPARANSESTDAWWTTGKGHRAAAVYRAAQRIMEEQGSRRQLELLHMSMYAAGNISGDGLRSVTRFQASSPIRLRLNLCEAICDALQAKIAKIRPRPRFITEGGSWGLRKRAEAAEQAMDGEFHRNDIDTLGPECAVDAFVTGTGDVHVLRNGCGHPVAERCQPGEVLVGYFDGLRRAPRTMYRARLMDRDYVLETWGGSPQSKRYQQIMTAPSAPANAYSWLKPTAALQCEQIFVIDAWHKGKNPQHVMVAGDAEVWSDEQWDGKEFPIVTMRWKARQYGWYGKGAVEEITPQQVEVNYTLEKIQHILHNVSTVRYWVQAGGKIEFNAQRATNFPGEMLRFSGPTAPVKEATDSVPRELWESVDRAQASAYKQTGISEFFAQSEKPAGLNSGEAQRVYEDVGDARMLIKGRNYEKWHMSIVERMVDCKREIANDPTEPETPVVSSRKRARGVTVKTLGWKDFDLSQTTYMLQVLEQSALPGTPAGKTATVNEWLQMGLITPDEGKELLNMPDLKAELSLSLSTKDSVLSAIECIADDGEWYAPHAMMDLSLATRLSLASYTRLEWEGLPEERLEMVARYIEELRALTELAAPPAVAAPMGAQMPGAAPGLPMVPGGMPGVAALPAPGM